MCIDYILTDYTDLTFVYYFHHSWCCKVSQFSFWNTYSSIKDNCKQKCNKKLVDDNGESDFFEEYKINNILIFIYKLKKICHSLVSYIGVFLFFIIGGGFIYVIFCLERSDWTKAPIELLYLTVRWAPAVLVIGFEYFGTIQSVSKPNHLNMANHLSFMHSHLSK